jgi:hypothetical protein
LTPDSFAQDFVAALDIDKRSNANKKLHDDFALANEGKEIMKAADYALVLAMRDRCLKNPIVQWLVESTQKEVSFFWHSNEELCRGRADAMHVEYGMLFDFKTTDDCRPNEVRRFIEKRGVDRQAAFYIDGCSQVLGKQFKTFNLIVVEKTEPFDMAFYTLGEKTICAGRELYQHDLELYKQFELTGRTVQERKQFALLEISDWAQNIKNR